MADTLWIQPQHSNLLRDIKDLLEVDGEVIGCAGLHTGQKVIESFFGATTSFGLCVEVLDWVNVPIGAGLCEDVEWTNATVISDHIEDRRKFMVCFRIRHEQ